MAKPEIVVVAVLPVIAPGLRVQFPTGNPESTTLPIATAQVGWVIKPTTGEVGVVGCTLMTILADATEIHPSELVTV